MAGLSVAILNALQEQYNHEIHNSHRYKTRAAWADYKGLTGIRDFFEKQANDENGHANIIYEYLNDRGYRIGTPLIGIDEVFPEDVRGVFESSYDVELDTTERLKNIYALAHGEGDYMTAGWMLTGLIAEQREEEDTFMTIIDRYNVCQNDHLFDVWIKENYLGKK